ncbi:MAG: VCBS repeat-containing protein [Melioribacteraceae bacterium]
MKKEDLKRHCKEDKRDLMQGKFTLLFLFISLNIYAQIPLNGFCRFREFSTKVNASNIFAVDVNNDGWRDLITLFDQNENYNFQIWSKEKFSNPSEKFLNISLYNLRLKSTQSKGGKKYVFFSRKERLIGLSSFSSSGNMSINSKVKLRGFASDFDLQDIDNDGNSEILIYGSAYDGLSIFNESKNFLYEKKIKSNRIYSYAAYIDLDYDGFTDIAAVDLFTNSIVFFYNNRAGDFRESRTLNAYSNIEQFKAVDVNSDGFNDLMYVEGNHFVILKGDSVSSFNKKIFVDCPVHPDKYLIFDFNADGYNDIAFINKDTGSLYIIYAKNTEAFYYPVLYLKRPSIVDIEAYVDRGGRKIIALDKSGKVYLIDKVISLNDDLAISLQSKLGIIGSFSYMYQTWRGLFFIDEEEMSLNVLLGGRGNYFERYFKILLSKAYKKYFVDETDEESRTFYFYSPYNSVIEIIKMNFEKNEISRRILYAKGNILELKVIGDILNDRQTIYVLSKKENTLFFESYEYRDFRYVKSGLEEISRNVEDAALSDGATKEIYFFTRFNNVFYLNKSIFDKKIGSPINLATTVLDKSQYYSAELQSFSSQNKIDKTVVGVISDSSKTNITVFVKGHIRTITLSDFSYSKGYLYFYESDGTDNFLLYDKIRGRIKKISFGKYYLTYKFDDVFESQNINSYIAAQLKNNIDMIIYTDSSNNLIRFKYIR